ncbi:hypothetical protein N3K66_006271 [Trichothecium roseum]|uniref:Uncharacterized protein n=1 Tax=Trichothecium roseum TaxID=47278 RepID=A0ACC0V2W5_9HYPO|nr:hypothetical protein N3K66_006271 [Trichothecium roseum]
MRLPAALLLSVAATAIAGAIPPVTDKICRADWGLEYRECNSACPPTCEEPEPRICTAQCVQGCGCKKGLIRNKDGRCVKPHRCPKNA